MNKIRQSYTGAPQGAPAVQECTEDRRSAGGRKGRMTGTPRDNTDTAPHAFSSRNATDGRKRAGSSYGRDGSVQRPSAGSRQRDKETRVSGTRGHGNDGHSWRSGAVPDKTAGRGSLAAGQRGASGPVRLSGVMSRQRFVPDAFFCRAMELMPRALDAVMPLRSAHRSDLPNAIRELSAQLTTERGALSRPYWTSPRLVSAYLRYFLPWNLLRLHRLFRDLPLPSPEGDAPVLLDIGSGPLSVPVGLWLSRPEWRQAPVRLVCADTAPHPMALGEAVFRKLAELCGEPLRWQIRAERRPLLRALALPGLSPRLITGGNVLNEWQDRNDDADDTLADRLGEVAEAVARALPADGMALFVEPGTRLGGTLTASLRTALQEEGLFPVAPCPHDGACPLLGRRNRGWCHVHEELAANIAPSWLTGLTESARLAKQSLSYAYLLCRPRADEEWPPAAADVENVKQHVHTDGTAGEEIVPARLLSDTFLVPELGQARYACSERGLLLVAHAARFGAGALIRCRIPAKPRQDAKSGAIVAEPVDS